MIAIGGIFLGLPILNIAKCGGVWYEKKNIKPG